MEETTILKPGESMRDYKAPNKAVEAPKKKLTKKEAFKLSKEEQTDLLNELGVETIPAIEAQRVEKILELQ